MPLVLLCREVCHCSPKKQYLIAIKHSMENPSSAAHLLLCLYYRHYRLNTIDTELFCYTKQKETLPGVCLGLAVHQGATL
jgi:hypothetical protein